MRLIYHPEAEAEVIEAARFYQTRGADLGIRFLDAVEEAVQSIRASPMMWPVVQGDVRRRRVSRFPYSILYRQLAVELRILTVKHHSRDDEYWQHRVGGD